jgi:hypothetical protein
MIGALLLLGFGIVSLRSSQRELKDAARWSPAVRKAFCRRLPPP